MEDFLDVELEILSPTLTFPEDKLSNSSVAAKFAIKGAFKECIQSCIKHNNELKFQSIEQVSKLKETVFKFLENGSTESRPERELQILCYGVSCLQLFVINNWTGPEVTKDLESLVEEISLSEMNNDILRHLEINGEQVYSLVDKSVLLYIAMTVFQNPEIFIHCKTAHWWCLRYISIHQQLLSERSPQLHTLSVKVVENLMKEDFLNKLERSHKIQLHLEVGLLQLYYYQYKDAEVNFEAATKISAIHCNLDGALGVRTKFQQKPVAQLRVQVTRTNNEPLHTRTPRLEATDIPKALPLNDDTLLETVKFSENSGNDEESIDVTAEEHALMLTMCTNLQKTSAQHRLRDEQIMCLIQYLVSDPKSWSVHTEALRVRCNLEQDRSRTVERSMMQLESLVKNASMKNTSSDVQNASSVVKRLSLFYSVWPKPSWILQKQLASLFEKLGVLSSALEIYKRLHMWEEAIICLIRTDRGHEAKELIHEQLKIKETPTLLCLLGDITQDPEMYSKAWELSNHRFARSMRSLGAYNISKKLYKEAVECFEKSLSVNYLQVGAWFSMGCAALAGEDYEKAAKAFQKCVSLNWDNFEAWTNLSTAFVRCNKKEQAFRALKEALKCNFERWELWENYLFVSVDTGHFQDVINAYNRLLDLKEKYVDTAVLRILVHAITQNMEDAYEVPASKLKPKALLLFGRLTSKVTSNWEIWWLYAKLLGNGVSGDNTEDNDKALNYLQKALRSSMQRQAWEKEGKSATQNVAISKSLVEACVYCHEQKSLSGDQLQPILASTRLSINGIKAKLKMQEKSLLKDDARKHYGDLAHEVESTLEILNGLLATS